MYKLSKYLSSSPEYVRRALLALDRVQQTQSAFWEALGELEALTGAELDGTRDYSADTVDDVLEMAEEEEEL